MKYANTIVGCSFLYLSSAHAINQGQIMVKDPVMGSRSLTYTKVNGSAVVEGDILIGKVDDLDKKGAVILNKINGGRWSQGIVPYKIHKNLPFRNKLAIFQAIDNLQKNTHLEFVELNSENSHKYADYIYFIPAGGTTCSSFVGRQGGMQEINLSPRCTTTNTVHEIGHAIGLWHEQSRSDRNLYIKIVWENIEDDYRSNFDQQLNSGKDYGTYDYASIMHYGTYAFSKNGQKTIIPLQDGVEIGQRTKLSEKDIEAINAMYPNS